MKGKTALQQRKTNYKDNKSWSPLERAADKYMIIFMVTLHPHPGNRPHSYIPSKIPKEGIVTSLLKFYKFLEDQDPYVCRPNMIKIGISEGI